MDRKATLDHQTIVPAHLQKLVCQIAISLRPMTVRNVKYYANTDTSSPVLVFDPVNYRFCLNIKRKHLKNNVYFMYCINTRRLSQKCFKCIGYTSEPMPLAF